MAQNIKITVDINQLKQKINQIKYDVATLQVNGSKVTIGGKKLTNEVKQATAATNELGRAAKNAGNAASNSTKQATNGLKAFTAEGKSSIGFIKTFVQSFVTPWTIAIFAIEGAIKTFKYMWNNLTDSVEKQTAKANSNIKAAQIQIKKTEQRTKSVNDLIGKLEELNKLESLNDDQRAVGASTINRLNREYKVFGITLDETTDKYQGLYQAKMKLDAANKAEQVDQIQKQIQAQKLLVNSTIKDVMGSGLEIGKPINGNDLFTFAERYNKTLGSRMKNELAAQWGGGKDLVAIRTVFQRLMDGLSTRQNKSEIQKIIDEINKLIEYYNQLSDINSISKAASDSAERLAESFEEQRKAIKATREEVEKLNKQYEDSQKRDAFNSLSPKDQIKTLQDEIKALEERNKVLEETKETNQKLSIQNQSNKQASKSQQSSFYNQQQSLQDDIEARKAANIQLDKDINAHYQKFGKQRSAWQNEFDILDKSIKASETYSHGKYRASEKQYARRAQLAEYLAQVDAPVNEMRAIIAANKKAITEGEARIKELNPLIADAEKQVKEFGDAAQSAEQASLEAEREKIQNLTIIDQKKKRQIQLTKQIAEQERKALEAAAQNNRLIAQQQQNAEQTLASIAEKGQIEMLRKQGKTKQADVKQRESIVKTLTKQIESQLGRPLGEMDQALRNSIEAGADIQMALKGIDMQKPQSPQSDQVYSNELARMGGFSSSIVVDRMDVNKQILDVNRKANDNLNTIASSVQKIYDNTTL